MSMMPPKTSLDPLTPLHNNQIPSKQADSKEMDRTCRTLRIAHRVATATREVVASKAKAGEVDFKVRDEVEAALVMINNNTARMARMVMAFKVNRDKAAINRANRGRAAIQTNNNRFRKVVPRDPQHSRRDLTAKFDAMCPKF